MAKQYVSFSILNVLDAGIYHGSLTFKNRNTGASALKNSEIIQFDSKSVVLSIAVTEFHTFIVYPERIAIIMQPPGLCSGKPADAQSDLAQVPVSSLKTVYQELFAPVRSPYLILTQTVKR
jgi:hypothetical protein